MMKNKLYIVIFTLLFSATLFMAFAAENQNVIASPAINIENQYTKIVDYLRLERQAEAAASFTPAEFMLFFALDLILSLFCLGAAVILFSLIEVPFFKTFPWFLFVFNFTWFLILLLLRLAWMSFGLLLVRLQADLAPIIIDNLSFFIIIFACLIYIWLLARSFGLNFLSALGVFLFSHIFYFLIIFLFFSFVTIKENRFFNLAKENLGIKPVIKSYLSDVDNVTSAKSVLDLIRFRAFHL